eukprot:360433-Chlamydomonas_euryale.AAC.8
MSLKSRRYARGHSTRPRREAEKGQGRAWVADVLRRWHGANTRKQCPHRPTACRHAKVLHLGAPEKTVEASPLRHPSRAPPERPTAAPRLPNEKKPKNADPPHPPYPAAPSRPTAAPTRGCEQRAARWRRWRKQRRRWRGTT